MKKLLLSALIALEMVLPSISQAGTSSGANVEFIPSNKNLGVGILNPNTKLTVNGNLAIKEGSAPSASSSYGKLYANSSNSKLYFLDDSGNSYNLLNGSTASLTDATTLDTLDSSEFLRSNTTDNFTSGVLITDSGTRFDVNGDLSIADTNISLDGANTTFTQSSGNISLIPASGKDLTTTIASAGEFKINTNDLVFNGSNARFGIKRHAPAYSLDVNGTSFAKVFNINGNTTSVGALSQGSLLFAKSSSTIKELTKGSNHYVLKVNGNTLAWEASSAGGGGSPGGSNTNVQFNNSSSFGGSSNFTWDNASNKLTVTGQILVNNGTTDEPGLRFISSNTGISSSNPSSNLKVVVQGSVPMHINSSNVGIGTSSVDTTLEVNGAGMFNTIVNKTFYTNSSAANVTIDWNNGNKQKITLAQNGTFAFTAPSTGVGSYTLVLTQNGTTGSRKATWPASVKWPGGTAPTLSTAPGYIDVVSCVYDSGPVYYCQIGLDFR